MAGNFTLYEEFFNTETRTGYMDLQDELESITSINGKPDNIYMQTYKIYYLTIYREDWAELDTLSTLYLWVWNQDMQP